MCLIENQIKLHKAYQDLQKCTKIFLKWFVFKM